MRILVTNDDGVHAPGLKALAEAMRTLGEVVVVAPEHEQSGTSHSLSLHRPLRIKEHGPDRFGVDGTPSDSVYLALNHVLKGRAPDVVVSGVNHGANLGDDITYSGTVAAAMEATMIGVPAVAFSLAQRSGPWDFAPAVRFAASLVSTLASQRLPRGVLLNVNVPRDSDGVSYRVTRQGRRSYGQDVLEKHDPRGRPYYWIGGDELAHVDLPGSDANAVYDERIISVTPLHLDYTHDATRADVEGWTLPGTRRRSGNP